MAAWETSGWFRLPGVAAVLAAALVANGCAQVLGIEEIDPRDGAGGSTPSCDGSVPGECDDDNPCTADACDVGSHSCVHEPITGSPPDEEQQPGDCQTIECTEGVPARVEQSSDVPVDGRECTEDACAGSDPVNEPLPLGTECSQDGGEICDGHGDCRLADGAACTQGVQCASGHCPAQDQVCCNEPCTGMCVACLGAKTGGIWEDGVCATIIDGQDPDDECEQSCNGDGACQDGCGASPIAPGAGTCPTVCTGGCPPWSSGHECLIECDEADECSGSEIVCPQGYRCTLTCTVNHACRSATVTCPDQYECSVSCSGSEACEGSTVNCSADGPCLLHCGDQGACNNVGLICGDNACEAACDAGYPPTVTCNNACSCTTC